MTAAQARELATTPELPRLNSVQADLFNRTLVKIRAAAVDKKIMCECSPHVFTCHPVRETFEKMGYNLAHSDVKYVITW